MKNLRENTILDDYIPDFGLPYPDLEPVDISVGAQNRAIRSAWFAVRRNIATAFNKVKSEVDNADKR